MAFVNIKIKKQYLSFECTECGIIKDDVYVIFQDHSQAREFEYCLNKLKINYSTPSFPYMHPGAKVIILDKAIGMGKQPIDLGEKSYDIYNHIKLKRDAAKKIRRYMNEVLPTIQTYASQFNVNLPIDMFRDKLSIANYDLMVSVKDVIDQCEQTLKKIFSIK